MQLSHLGSVDVSELEGKVPSLAVPGALARIRASLTTQPRTKLVVIDDDPTGTQTVCDVPVLMAWDDDDLEWAFTQPQPTVAVLTNTRSLPETEAVAINQDLGRRLGLLARARGVELRCLSRSDSTLRGHFPAEVDGLRRGLEAARYKIDGVLLCPAFVEAGRVTVGGVHWVRQGTTAVPVAATEFADDSVFGYRDSDLRAWAAERGAIVAGAGQISLSELREGGASAVASTLTELHEGEVAVADSFTRRDLEVLALGTIEAEARGRRFIYRTGPSFVGVRAGQTLPRPLDAAQLGVRQGPGLVVVGSHTELTSAQLSNAHERHSLASVELAVDTVTDPAEWSAEIDRASRALERALSHGDAALATTRRSLPAPSGHELEMGQRISDGLVETVRRVADRHALGWVVAKGGITSAEIARRALRAARATVVGPLFTGGVSVWRLEGQGPNAKVPYVVFPGNVGGDDALSEAISRLKAAG